MLFNSTHTYRSHSKLRVDSQSIRSMHNHSNSLFYFLVSRLFLLLPSFARQYNTIQCMSLPEKKKVSEQNRNKPYYFFPGIYFLILNTIPQPNSQSSSLGLLPNELLHHCLTSSVLVRQLQKPNKIVSSIDSITEVALC